jgi:threonine aldolase
LKPSYIKKIKSLANKYSIKMHLDGARCLNAAVFLKISPKIMTEDFDTVSVCLSKGLGCPIGSLILGTE